MTRFVLAVASIIYGLFVFTTGVGATCEACPNCDYDRISIEQGNACLNYWTCSGDTISCFYPSVENPGTYTECSYSASAVSELSYSNTCRTQHLFQDWALTSGPSDLCFSYAGDNSKCEPSNNPYNLGLPGCTASYGYVGGVNSGLL